MKLDAKEFITPDRKHTGTELFMLNGTLTSDELHEQMKGLHEQGFQSVIARTYIGIDTPYPSDEFMDRIDEMIRDAEEYGMSIYLQAGFMPAGVPDLPSAFSQRKIKAVQKDAFGEGTGTVLCEHDGFVFVEIINPHSIDMLSQAAMRHYLKASYEDFWQRFRSKFGSVCRSVWVDEPDFGPVDLPWTTGFDTVFAARYGYDIKEKLFLLFMDKEGYEKVRYDYWRLVTDLLKNGYYAEVASWCHANNLEFSGHLMCEDSMRLQIMRTANCMPLYRYFSVPGIDFLSTDFRWPKHNYNNYRFLQTPLQCSSIAHQTGKTEVLAEMFGVSSENLTIEKQKYVFDMIAVFGINRRCIHAIFYSLKGARKRRYVPHIGYYQPYFDDYLLFNDYCARVSYFLKCAKPYAEVLVLSPVESAYTDFNGRYDTGFTNSVFSPFTKAPSLGETSDKFILDKLEETDNNFTYLLRKLSFARIAYELGDEDTISDLGSVTDDNFIIGEMQYKTVLISDLKVLRGTTLTLLECFLKNGGKVVVNGSLPAVLDGSDVSAKEILSHPNVTFTDDADHAVGYLKNLPRLVTYTDEAVGGDVYAQIRKENGEILLFVMNSSEDSPYRGTVTVEGAYSAELFDAVKGEIVPYSTVIDEGKTTFFIELSGGESILLHLTENAVSATLTEPKNGGFLLPVTGAWQVERSEKNVLLLEFCQYKTENGSFSASDMPIIPLHQKLCDEHYRGKLTLRYRFTVDGEVQNCSLAGELMAEKTITLNGTVLPGKTDGYYLAKDFETVSVQHLIKQGENVLEVETDFIPYEKPSDNLFMLIKKIPGTELENFYLIGDFAVVANTEPTDTNCIRFNKNFKLTPEKKTTYGELTTAGYPFYAGRFTLKKIVSVQKPFGKRIFLTFGQMDLNHVKVFVNGTYAGVFYCKPYRVDITDFLTDGENIIALEAFNTLRNLIGPHHRPAGEKYETWGRYIGPDDPWLGGSPLRVPNWYEHRTSDSSMWTEGYLQIPQGLRDIAIIIE